MHVCIKYPIARRRGPTLSFLIGLALLPLITSCALADKGNASTVVRPEADQVACAQDVKQCPDGSFVGRIGPRCEFKCAIIARDVQQNCAIQLNRWITQYEPIANGAVPTVRGNARLLAVELAKVRYQCANSAVKEGEAYHAPDELSKLASNPEIVKQAVEDIKAGTK
jgi:hypothetical protein